MQKMKDMEEEQSVKKSKMKPSLRLSSSDLKEIKDWDVGEKYTLKFEVEMTGLNKAGDFEIEYNDMKEGEMRAEFEIQPKSIKVM